jgi:hypothetical protein
MTGSLTSGSAALAPTSDPMNARRSVTEASKWELRNCEEAEQQGLGGYAHERRLRPHKRSLSGNLDFECANTRKLSRNRHLVAASRRTELHTRDFEACDHGNMRRDRN